ncbi:MAG: hypothetical protein QME77_11570 [bacterium]|nr:hypothetical protein [bacterium]
MPSGREELRRGIRNVIEAASREMGALTDPQRPEAGPADSSAEGRVERPLLRLVRETQAQPAPPALKPVTIPRPVAVHPTRGVCFAYQINQACWEVPDAYCNLALHLCMLRECPVFDLNRSVLDRRFAAKYAHLW